LLLLYSFVIASVNIVTLQWERKMGIGLLEAVREDQEPDKEGIGLQETVTEQEETKKPKAEVARVSQKPQ
jgi:hypothetical protein